VISSARPGPIPVDMGKFAGNFLTHVRAVEGIPFDRHLAEGAEVSLELMNRKTRQAFMGLAATLTDGFGKAAHRPAGQPESGRLR
jgi:MinD-like ATPase involved in chromosome partitioning or flagellar assembly